MEFEANTRVRVKTAPDRVGRITGKFRERAGKKRYQVDFGPSGMDYIIEGNLEIAEETLDIYDLIERSHYGGILNLRSIITYTRLTGRLADVIYSMESTNTEFYPYQFKPVLNFLDSPSQGILIADEVGLGKTIEAGLIWTELRARYDASRLLILCPAVLREKWRDELAFRFGVKADICNADEILSLIKRDQSGAIQGFAAIASQQGLRPPNNYDEQDSKGFEKGAAKLARYFSDTNPGEKLFDAVIIDEAHYLRNPSTQTHELGRLTREVSEYAVFLSATPIQLKSEDLFHLLNLIDSESFQFPEAFQRVLQANQPLIDLTGKLRRNALTKQEYKEGLANCLYDPLLEGNRQLEHLYNNAELQDLDDISIREKLASRIERVNLLARVVNRTRKREVQENRVIREVNAPTVEMNAIEEEFYTQITDIVREYSFKKDLHEKFLATIPQRQMCSSMPAAFRAWQKKSAYILSEEFLYESGLDEEEEVKKDQPGPLITQLALAVEQIASFELLKAGDSKFNVLIKKLTEYWSQYPDKKIILFSYYRETLFYLKERFDEERINALVLVGGQSSRSDSKQQTIEKFKNDSNIKLLLASEVASEGVDMQFASFLINYDLPWNPMRVEQRIGRIDRIGQKEKKIHIWNFFYADTLDDRIYTRLFDRLEIFTWALGDIEVVLGEKINDLTRYLLSHKLTKADEEEQIQQTEAAIERIKREKDELEEEAAHLAAHGDFILNKVKAAQEMRRYIDGSELWIFVRDGLNQKFPGCDLVRVEDDPLTVEIGLSQVARVELHHYLEINKKLGKTQLLQSKKDSFRTKCIFANQVDFHSSKYEVINQYHPLVRFIAHFVNKKKYHPLVATFIPSIKSSGYQPGKYLICAQIWSTTGSKTVEKLVYKGLSLENNQSLTDTGAEKLLTQAIESGEDWPAVKTNIDPEQVLDAFESLNDIFDDEFSEHAKLMSMENEDRIDHLIKNLTDKVHAEIQKQEEIIAKFRMTGKEKLIHLPEGKIRKRREYLELQTELLEKQRKEVMTDVEKVTSVVVSIGG